MHTTSGVHPMMARRALSEAETLTEAMGGDSVATRALRFQFFAFAHNRTMVQQRAALTDPLREFRGWIAAQFLNYIKQYPTLTSTGGYGYRVMDEDHFDRFLLAQALESNRVFRTTPGRS